MAKAEVTITEKQEYVMQTVKTPEIKLTLTVEEAIALLALTGGVCGSSYDTTCKFTSPVYAQLHSLIARNTGDPVVYTEAFGHNHPLGTSSAVSDIEAAAKLVSARLCK